MIPKINVICFIFFVMFMSVLNCGDAETSRYLLAVDGYKDNFTGYYKLDGQHAANFVGEKVETDGAESPYYYFEEGIDNFDSIKVFAFKNSEKCSLTVSIWRDRREVASVTSGENDGYDESTNTFKLAVDPLYYEIEVTSTTDDYDYPDDHNHDDDDYHNPYGYRAVTK